MYSAHPSLRYLFVFGLFGLAVLTPPKDVYPTWLVMSAIMAPLVLLELGAGLEDEAARPSVFRWARLLQRAGAGLFVFDLGLLLALRGLPFDRDTYFGMALSASGAIAALLVMRSGGGPASDSGFFRSRWYSSGASVVAVICLLFTLVSLWIVVTRPAHAGSSPLLAGMFFFGGGFFVSVSQLMSRWRLERGISGPRTLQDLTQLLGFFGMGLSCVLFALAEDAPTVARFLAGPFGLFLMAGGLWLTARRFFGARAGHSYHVVREGLLEKSRRHVLLYPWADLASASLGEYQGNSALFIHLEDSEDCPQVLWHRANETEKAAKRRRKAQRTNAALTGAELLILETSVDEDLGDLFRALEAAMSSEASRAELPPAAQFV